MEGSRQLAVIMFATGLSFAYLDDMDECFHFFNEAYKKKIQC